MNIFKKWLFKKELKEYQAILDKQHQKIKELRAHLDQRDMDLELIKITINDYMEANKEKKQRIDELEKKLKIKKTKPSKK